MLSFVLLFVALYACAHAQIDSPNGAARGAQIRLSKTGLQYMADVGVAALQRNVNNLHVPNQSGKSGSISWDASNIVVHSLHVRELLIHFSARDEKSRFGLKKTW